ncbi:hypothetical protein [Sodalis sp. RH22]|uniref:hypothetical protein n=1 Tax=unclassified Sodalis (in: enterobacteria) TaxID=2636512 RepID=UPI0039B3E224
MNIQQNEAGQDRHSRWLKIAAVVWLFTISFLTIINTVGVTRQDHQQQTAALDAKAEDMAKRLADIERQVDADKRQPKPVTRAEFTRTRQAFQARIDQFEQAHAAIVQVSDLKALQDRVESLARFAGAFQKPAPVAAVRRPVAKASKPTVPNLPFRVVEMELRGGERLLSVAPLTSTTLNDVRLLRQGDAESGWILQSIEADAALFRAGGQARRVPLSRE